MANTPEPMMSAEARAARIESVNHQFGLTGPISLHVNNGRVGFWSRDASSGKRFVSLDPVQAVLLLQFVGGPRTAIDAAEGAGVDYDSNVDGLLDEFLRCGILAENPPECDVPFYRFHHPELGEDEPLCVVEPDAFDPATVRSIVDGLRGSKLVGGNILSQDFAGTHGFGVKFRGEAVERLTGWLPWIRPFFDKALDESVARRFGSPPSASTERVNAFYFNALAIPPGGGTALHVDCTIDGVTPASWVSVLYLETVPPPGGRLFLQKGSWPVGIVNPRPGMMIHFRGDLNHGVTDTRFSDAQRSSLVCEQYCLPPDVLDRCPYLEFIKSSDKGR